ncbi:WXG100-like domain-containing protein [Nonomuraea sp. NPDC001699]
MAVTLDPQVAGFLNLIGFPWPNDNEDEWRLEADDWRVVIAASDSQGAAAGETMRSAQQVYQGDSATHLASHWNQVGDGGGHISQAASAAKVAPAVLDGTANVVSAVKLAVGTQAAYGLTVATQALLFGGAAGGMLALARMQMTRHAVGKVAIEGAEGTARGLAPVLSGRVTEKMRRIMKEMEKRPHARDGMLQIRRRRGGGGGNKGGKGGGYDPNASASYDSAAQRMHGRLPDSSDVSKMTPEQARQAAAEVKDSILTRKMNEARLGRDPGHAARLENEQKLLNDLERKANEGK